MQCNKLRRKPKSIKKCWRSHCGVWEAGPWGAVSLIKSFITEFEKMYITYYLNMIIVLDIGEM